MPGRSLNGLGGLQAERQINAMSISNVLDLLLVPGFFCFSHVHLSKKFSG